MTYRPLCNHCAGTGERTVEDFGSTHTAPCIECDGSGKGPAPDDCKDCGGKLGWWTLSHPDDEPEYFVCAACCGTGLMPEFSGQGVA